MSIEQGGSVFPFSGTAQNMHGVSYPVYGKGMTLRDHYAGQALSALLTRGGLSTRAEEGLAATAYRIADALLAERAKRQDGQ